MFTGALSRLFYTLYHHNIIRNQNITKVANSSYYFDDLPLFLLKLALLLRSGEDIHQLLDSQRFILFRYSCHFVCEVKRRYLLDECKSIRLELLSQSNF